MKPVITWSSDPWSPLTILVSYVTLTSHSPRPFTHNLTPSNDSISHTTLHPFSTTKYSGAHSEMARSKIFHNCITFICGVRAVMSPYSGPFSSIPPNWEALQEVPNWHINQLYMVESLINWNRNTVTYNKSNWLSGIIEWFWMNHHRRLCIQRSLIPTKNSVMQQYCTWVLFQPFPKRRLLTSFLWEFLFLAYRDGIIPYKKLSITFGLHILAEWLMLQRSGPNGIPEQFILTSKGNSPQLSSTLH